MYYSWMVLHYYVLELAFIYLQLHLHLRWYLLKLQRHNDGNTIFYFYHLGLPCYCYAPFLHDKKQLRVCMCYYYNYYYIIPSLKHSSSLLFLPTLVSADLSSSSLESVTYPSKSSSLSSLDSSSRRLSKYSGSEGSVVFLEAITDKRVVATKEKRRRSCSRQNCKAAREFTRCYAIINN